jgi:hypothetical protein
VTPNFPTGDVISHLHKIDSNTPHDELCPLLHILLASPWKSYLMNFITDI